LNVGTSLGQIVSCHCSINTARCGNRTGTRALYLEFHTTSPAQWQWPL